MKTLEIRPPYYDPLPALLRRAGQALNVIVRFGRNGVNAKQPRPGTLALARELLCAADPPYSPLRQPQPVTRWNVVTGEVVEVYE